MHIIIDTSAAKRHVVRLKHMHRSAFPVVVRQTLNKAAFDVKTTTMPQTSQVFIHRKPTFFKANSKVVQATGFNLNSMQATIGFVPKADTKDTSVSDLEQQEHGGDISGRAFIPLKQNRIGNSWTGNVRTAGRYRSVRSRIVDSADSKAVNKAGQFHSSAAHAYKKYGAGAVVIGSKENANGNKMAWRIMGPRKKGKFPNKRLLFAVKKGRKVDPAATHFMRDASLMSQKKMQGDFIKLAEAKLMTVR